MQGKISVGAEALTLSGAGTVFNVDADTTIDSAFTRTAQSVEQTRDAVHAQTSAMLAEALSLGQKGGLDWQDMWRVIGASAVASPIVKAKGVQLSQHDYTPTFTVGQMNKDIDLILAEGARLQVPLTQTAATRQLMAAAQAQGDGGLDYAAIIRVLQRASGLPT